jgi:antitoxin (DNA-binding transcriptional repressor) of toxin-antitoxin stability system
MTRCGLRAVADEEDRPLMLTRVSEAEVTAHFAELLERAQAGETILVERDGVPVCRLGPPGPACTLDAFTRFLERIHAEGGVREVTESPQRLA